MIIDRTSTSTTGTNFWRSAGSEWRVTEWRDGELGKWPKSILPHITLKSIIPHITDRQPRIRRHTAAMLNAAHQHLEQFTWTVQSSPILSSIPAAAANSGNCTSMQCNGVQTGGLPVQRVTRGLCTVVPFCTLVHCGSLCVHCGAKLVVWCKVHRPSNFREILSSNCSRTVTDNQTEITLSS